MHVRVLESALVDIYQVVICGIVSGLGPNTFANLLPASGGGSNGLQYGTPGNQFSMVRHFFLLH